MNGRYSRSSSSSSDSKKLKSSTEDPDGDRLSDLPEAILHHILSFLNMKHAVKTCVLSRTWRNLWASLPFLNFDEELENFTYQEPTVFRDFVDQVLLQRDNTCIQKFHLYCPRVNRLNTWILYARNRNVQELSITIRDGWINRAVELLHGLFTCTSLKVLNLKYTDGDLKHMLPHTINLPVLQTLRLDGLLIAWGVDSFDKLFYACPILESLTIKNCSIHFSHLNISSPKLRQLVIDNNHGLVRYALKVYAPNLLSFSCKDKMLIDYSLENLSSLVKADICLGRDGGLSESSDESSDDSSDESSDDSSDESSEEEEERQDWLSAEEEEERYTKSTMKVLRVVQKVTTLTLSGPGSIFQAFSESDALQGTQFCNLRCLKVRANNSKDCNWIKGVTCLLKISPNIETVSLTGEMSDSVDIGDYQEAGLSLGNLKHLKFVEFKNASGSVNELKFLENLLKNAVGLEKLLIVFLPSPHLLPSPHSPDRGRHRERFGQKLLAFPTVSSLRVTMLIF